MDEVYPSKNTEYNIKMIRSFIVEGLDRLGKSSLIEGIQNKLGYFQVIHYGKPRVLDCYQKLFDVCHGDTPLRMYQEDSFTEMFAILNSSAGVILDRAHLGECVYAPMYRGYDGDYVFILEKQFSMDRNSQVRLILLTEDFSKSKHFVDDGLSLGTADKREAEQNLFIEAFNKSILTNKKIICVTAEDGSFRPKEDILKEAIE